MNNKINLNKAWLHQVFVQANTIKGYRYLDLAGIILNRIGDLYKEFTIDPAGCLLKEPFDVKDPYAIRFSTDRIWLQYTPIKSLTYVVDTAPEWIESIAKDMQVSRFSRLGLRSYFFTSCEDILKASNLLTQKVSGSIFQGLITFINDPEDIGIQYQVRVPIDNLIAAMRVTSVKIGRKPIGPTDFPSDGLLFDVDVYRRKKPPEGLPRAETRGFLKSAIDKTNELLEKVGYNLLEVNDGKES